MFGSNVRTQYYSNQRKANSANNNHLATIGNLQSIKNNETFGEMYAHTYFTILDPSSHYHQVYYPEFRARHWNNYW